MDLEQKPSWSKRDLRRLGEALVIDKAATPDGCPKYGEVMLWHNDLAAEVAARIADTSWVAVPPEQLAIGARAKTLDTLVQKLERTTLKLGQVQDVAGVRVDADMVLTQQTNLAQEIAEHFGAARATIKDIRENAHSGYRAVHVWLVLPAGRVEVQIRTLVQSEWANVYEDFGELVGRGIRYGEKHENADVRRAVDGMHTVSENLASQEHQVDLLWQLARAIEDRSPPMTPQDAELIEKSVLILEQHSDALAIMLSRREEVFQVLREARRKMTEEEEV
jgi:ppGpp synthetase/RelA/SpoT-type nucleotidyltranferase